MTPDLEAIIRTMADQVRHTSDRVDSIWAVLIGHQDVKGLIEVQREHGEALDAVRDELATHRLAMTRWEILPPPPKADA